MDPINQNGTPADAGLKQPTDPSMPPAPEPLKPADAANHPDAPLETEVNQFTPAEPPATVQTTPNAAVPEPSPAQIPPRTAEPAEPTPQQAPTPPQVDQVGTLDQTVAPSQSQPSAEFQTSLPVKKSKAGLIIVVIILLAVAGGGGYYYLTQIKEKTTSNTSNSSTEVIEETAPTPENAGTTTGGDVAGNYERATAISATADKAKAVDTVLSPILNKTFSNRVKLIDATFVLTYVANRAITAADVASVKTQLEAQGYKSADSTTKQLTMAKTGSTWVISFSVDSQTKAEIDVTY